MKVFTCALLTLSLLLPCTAASSTATPQALTLPAHALVLTMLEQGLEYDAESGRFVWLAAYYALTLFAPDDPQARWTEDQLTLPADRLAPLLEQMFSRLFPLPVRPRQLDKTITLSPDTSQLLLAAGDPAQTQLVWLSCHGTCWQAALVSPDADQPLCWAQITLNRAQNAIIQCTVTQEMPQTSLSAACSYSLPVRA